MKQLDDQAVAALDAARLPQRNFVDLSGYTIQWGVGFWRDPEAPTAAAADAEADQ